MDINWQQIMFMFLGGLGLFLFSIKYMGDGLQLIAGDRMRYLLDKYTTNPLLGVIVGIAVTALIQSSSATTVITVGLVGVGLLTLRQAIGIVMGANIGTTITSFIIGFDLSKYSLMIIFIGAVFIFFIKKEKFNHIGRVLFGFGGIFYALKLMSDAMVPLRDATIFQELMIKLGENPLLGVLMGTGLTVVIQSSSATIGILQNLYAEGAMSLQSSLPVLFGDNIGTTITAILAVLGSNISAKRVALSHVLFNLIGTLIFLILLNPFTILVIKVADKLHLGDKMTIAFAHGMFNVTNTIILFPFIGVFVYVVVKLIPGEDEIIKYSVQFLDKGLISTAPSIAIGQAKKELLEMSELAMKNMDKTIEYFHYRAPKVKGKIEKIEEAINLVDVEITSYITQLFKEKLTEKERINASSYLDIIRDIERIGDHANNMSVELEIQAKKQISYSEEAQLEVQKLHDISREMTQLTHEAIRDIDLEKAMKSFGMHYKVYELEKKIRKNHIRRMNDEKCTIKAGLIYVDLISHYTRICDHNKNIVEKVISRQITE